MKDLIIRHNRLLLTILIFIGISLYYSIGNGVFPSIDGPSHWNNATLLKEYMLGNESVKQHFEPTTFYIPNATACFLLAFLLIFFKSTAAMIIFMFIHYMCFFLSFLYFLKAYRSNSPYFLSLIAVLFFNSFLLNIGFYNFSFSAAFLVLALGYYEQHFSSTETGWSKYMILFLLVALLFYSNALSLLLFFMFVGVKEITTFSQHIKTNTVKEFLFTSKGKLLVFLPFVIMIFLFQSKFPFQNPPMFSNDIGEYFSDLLHLGSFIVYQREEEYKFVQWIGYPLVILLSYSFFWRLKYRNGLIKQDVLLLVMIINLVLYLIIPNMYAVGMMSSRFLYFFFLFLILWLITQDTGWMKLLMVASIIVAVFFERDRRHIHALNQMNSKLELVRNASMYIEPNSVVLPLDYSGNWLERHFGHYIGADKPLIILDNYEATVGWFPLKWRSSSIPGYLLGDARYVEGAYNCINSSGKPKPIDYVFIYGDRRWVSNNPKLDTLLRSYYQEIDEARNGMSTVYKFKGKQ